MFCLAAVPVTACSVEVPEEAVPATPAPAKKKGGGTQGATAASSSGQKGGSNAESAQSSATSQGSEVDGLVCDASTESVGWCADDASIEFCSDATWWVLDCTQFDPDAFCAYDEDLNIVDCYVLVDEGDECSDLDEACVDDAECCSGICDDEGFCDDGGVDECDDPGVDCVDDAECCSGSCADDGFCD
jgi:hypothetical protein